MSNGILRDKNVKELTTVLTELIPYFQIVQGQYLDPIQALHPLMKADETLPKSGDRRRLLERYLGERPVADFVYNWMQELFYAKIGGIDTQENKSVAEIPNFGSLEQVAKEIVSDLNTLPMKYVVIAKLPVSVSSSLTKYGREIVLSQKVKIVKAGEAFMQGFSIDNTQPEIQRRLVQNGEISDDREGQGWISGEYYLLIEVEGYLGWTDYSKTRKDYYSLVASLVGIGLATSFLSPSHKFGFSRDQYIYSFKSEDNRTEFFKGELTIQHPFSNIVGQAEHQDAEVTTYTMSLIEKVLSQLEGEEPKKVERILLASEWFYKSNIEEDELMSFLQTTIVIEILLGSKEESEETGLATLLANRCAYLISNSHSEREEIKREFKKAYSIRSKIVHAGFHQISSNERQKLFYLRELCRRIICAEINLAVK